MIDISPVQEIVRLDGSDLELIEVRDRVAYLRLIIDDSDCADCVMPREILEGVAGDLLAGAGITAVRIEDPRER